MGRLTKRYSDGTHGSADDLPCGENSYAYKDLLIEKLGRFEDLEEKRQDGFPLCRYGDTIYAITCDYENEKYEVTEAKITEVKEHCTGQFYGSSICRPSFRPRDFGKTVFFTRKEAEQRMKELENGKE